jgi:heme-degrading monooxygenase HmoA
MIARIWHGVTRTADADRYARYIEETGLRAQAETPGNMGSFILRRPADGADGESRDTEFVVLSLWESLDAIRRFAGETPETAVFYPEDDAYLVRRDLTVQHYEVAAKTA